MYYFLVNRLLVNASHLRRYKVSRFTMKILHSLREAKQLSDKIHTAQYKEDKKMKVRASVKPICEKCKIIKRNGKVMIICENPKHKQTQG